MRRARLIGCLIFAIIGAPAPLFAGGITTCFIGLNLRESGPEPETPQESAARSASAVVSSARDQLHKTQSQIARQVELSPDLQSAKLSAMRAFIDYQLAKQAVVNTSRLAPEGLKAQIEIERLEQQLDDARQEAKLAGVDHSDKIDAVAIALLQKRSAASRHEAESMATDQKLMKLRYAWLDADANLAALEDTLAEQVHTDPQWRSAKNQLEQARTALASISR